jgi:hypothetical protein
MIVSALVATSRESARELVIRLESHSQVKVGVAQGGFIPVVTMTETLAQARDLHEALRLDPAVVDLQLVSWVDDTSVEDDALAEEDALMEDVAALEEEQR